MGGATVLKDVKVEFALGKPVRKTELRDRLVNVTGGAVTVSEDVGLGSDSDPRSQAAVGSRVLVVDDNEVNQDVATMLLESLGCHVDVVSDGAMAIAALRRRRYGLVFMDCQMPTLDGYQVTRQIRLLEEGNSISQEGRKGPAGRLPVVALTAHSMPSDRARSLECGMDDFLSKPFTRRELREVLERWLTGPAEGETPVESPALEVSESSDGGDDLICDAALEQIHELDRRSGGNGFERLVHIYLKKAEALMGDLRVAIGECDAEGIARAAHSLKSASYQLGAEKMGAVCADLEALGRRGVTDGAQVLGAELDRLHPAVAKALQARLDRRKVTDTAGIGSSQPIGRAR